MPAHRSNDATTTRSTRLCVRLRRIAKLIPAHRIVRYQLYAISMLWLRKFGTSTNKPEGSVRRYRSSLQQKCVELGYAWDVHDIHKHGLLTRASTLPNDKRPQVVRIGQVFQQQCLPK